MKTKGEYVPFGKEWETMLMTAKKKDIIEMYRKVCIRNLEMEELYNIF